MTRFVLLTFAFLGWAFFEMSGGTDFAPQRTALLEDPVEISDAVMTEDAPESEETRVSANPTPAPAPETAKVTLASATAADAPVAPVIVRRPLLSEPTPILPQDDLFAANRDTGDLTRPQNAALTAVGEASIGAEVGLAQQPVVPARDIRAVRGNRVNMRNGPGKQYSVVASLSRGKEVEVLQDPGNGWVKLKVIESEQIGWMAEFLLVAAN